MTRVAVVILNYNGKHFLEQFLSQTCTQSKGCEVIVADNQSTDDSVAYLKKHHPEVRLILNQSNGGYSVGYNEALAQINAEYFVLLNSDIEVSENWILPIVDYMDAHPGVAAAQPKILDFNNKGKFEYAGAAGGYIDHLGYPFCKGRLFQTLEEDKGQYDDVYPIFWATGACLIVRSEVYNAVGQLDEDFFAHMEEIDLCWRIWNAGHTVVHYGLSHVYHVGGGTLDKSNPKKTYLNFRNGLTLIFKNYSRTELIFKMPVRLMLDWIAMFKFGLFDSPSHGLAVWRAHFDFFIRDIRLNIKKRRNTLKVVRIRNKKEIYKGSVVLDYFLKKKKYFSELNFDC